MKRIVHLVDDTSPGGVTRLLDYIRSSPEMAAIGQHSVVAVGRKPVIPPRLEADVVVSHVVLSWRNMPFFLALRARARRRPMIHMEHSYSPAFEAQHVAKPRRFRAMLTASMALFDRVVTISTAQRDWLVGAVGVPSEKLALIPPHVDLSRFFALPPPEGAVRRIGALGRLDPQKGFDILVQAFVAADLPGVTLEIFGDGPQARPLKAWADGHPGIVFHGHVDDPVAAIASVDAIAMPSRREPYGLVALEALAAARPLLVSRADGLRDHAETGAIPVEALEVAAWAAALTRLVATDHATDANTARSRVAGAGGRFAEGWAQLIQQVTR